MPRFQISVVARGIAEKSRGPYVLTRWVRRYYAINRQGFVTNNLVGATRMEHMIENIASVDVVLDDTVLVGIEELHARYTYPCP